MDACFERMVMNWFMVEVSSTVLNIPRYSAILSYFKAYLSYPPSTGSLSFIGTSDILLCTLTTSSFFAAPADITFFNELVLRFGPSFLISFLVTLIPPLPDSKCFLTFLRTCAWRLLPPLGLGYELCLSGELVPDLVSLR